MRGGSLAGLCKKPWSSCAVEEGADYALKMTVAKLVEAGAEGHAATTSFKRCNSGQAGQAGQAGRARANGRNGRNGNCRSRIQHVAAVLMRVAYGR